MEFHRILVYIFCALILGCNHLEKISKNESKDNFSQTVEIRFKPKDWKKSTTVYHSYSLVKDMEGDQVTREKIEEMDFEVEETLLESFGSSGVSQSKIRAKTVKKDGAADLHDFSFPELNEEIEYIYDDRSRVLKAGIYPPESSYFTPPLPTPEDKVVVGDTWTMDHTWLSLKSGVPLGMKLVAILKGIESCQGEACYDIEVSGHVQIEGIKLKTAEFQSQLWGRLLYHPRLGQIIWSEIRSSELMTKSNQKTKVISCMGARLKGALGDRLPVQYPKRCQATAKPLVIMSSEK